MEKAQEFIGGVTEKWGELLATAKEETKKLVTEGLEGVEVQIAGITFSWSNLQENVSTITKTLKTEGVSAAISETIDIITRNWNTLAEALGVKDLRLNVSGITQAISDTIYSIWANWWNMLQVGGSKTISLLTQGISSWISSTISSLYSAWFSLLSLADQKWIILNLGGLFDKALGTIQTIVGLFEDVVNAWRTFLGLGGPTAARLTVNLDPGSLVPLTAPSLKIEPEFFQRGGIVLGKTLSVLGEAGPEAIVPLSRLPQVLASLSPIVERDIIGGGQTLTYAPVLNFYGNPEPGQVRREVVQAGEDWVFQIRR
jgi:hypothetical protein